MPALINCQHITPHNTSKSTRIDAKFISGLVWGGRRKINGGVVRRLRGQWSEDYADCGQKTTANYV
jgi:hypothetical protein